MQFAHDRVSLLAAAQVAASAAADRTTKPILACVKVVAEAGRLLVMGTNNEIGVRYELATEGVTGPGSAVLPPDKLLPILRQGGSTPIQFRDEAGKVRIQTANGKFDLAGQNTTEFPDVDAITDDEPTCAVNAKDLAVTLERVKVAADRTDGTARWATAGLLCEVAKGKITFAATDTRRLALVSLVSLWEHPPISGLLSLKAAEVVLKAIAAAAPDHVALALASNSVTFQVGPVTIHAKLIEGRFPPYRDIIPKKPAVTFPVPRVAFGDAITQAAVMTDNETLRVEFVFGPDAVELAAQTEIGKSEVRMELPEKNGPANGIEASFNPKYLLDCIHGCKSESLTIEMTDGSKPVVFRDGEDYLYLVMPLTG